MGALVTHMLLDNGRRVEVYSNGNGGAYYMNNGAQVALAPQSNGQFTEQVPVEVPQNVQATAPVASTPQVTPAPTHKDDSWGFWGWTWRLLLGALVLGGIVGNAVLWGASHSASVKNFAERN
jgi:hypothetical protein